MSVIPLVSDGRGAIVTRWPYDTGAEGYLVAHDPSCFDSGNASWDRFDLFTPESYGAYTGMNKSTQGKSVVKIYVNSTSGATVANDAGDGSVQNPYSCFNSAILRLSANADPATKVLGASITGCYCEEHVAQIIVTGVVDYAIHNNPGYIQVDRLLITGNGSTSFQIRNACDLINLAHYVNVQNCIVAGSESNFRGGIGVVCVFENCKVYTPSGLPQSFLFEWEMADSILVDSEFHATEATSVMLGYLYNSSIYIDNAGSTDDVFLEIFAIDHCNGLLQSSVGEDSHAHLFFMFNSTISGIDYDVEWN